MRKTSVLALTITLTATLIQATSASTPITAWGSCSSLEKKVTISGAPYHCIKTARGNYAYAPANVKSGAVQPRIEPTIAAHKVIDPIVLKAFNAYNHASCKGTHPNFTATYLTSPTYSPEMLAKQKVLFEQAMSCYSAYFDKPITINIALATEKDYDFMAAQKSGNQPLFDSHQLPWIQFMMHRIYPSSHLGRGAGSAGWSTTTNSAWVIMLDSSLNTSPDAHIAGHEFVHILQSYSKSVFFPLYGDGSTSADYLNLPTWFWEGTAELFSYASITATAGAFSAQMRDVRNQGKGAPTLNKISTPDGVVSTLKILNDPANPGNEGNNMFYALGSVMCEYILATYGYDKYWQIMKNAGVYKDFNENLQKTIGISMNDLFVTSAPWVLSQWKQNKF